MTVTEAGAVVEAPGTVFVAVAVAVAVPLKKSIMRRENKFNQSAHSMYDYHNSTAQQYFYLSAIVIDRHAVSTEIGLQGRLGLDMPGDCRDDHGILTRERRRSDEGKGRRDGDWHGPHTEHNIAQHSTASHNSTHKPVLVNPPHASGQES